MEGRKEVWEGKKEGTLWKRLEERRVLDMNQYHREEWLGKKDLKN